MVKRTAPAADLMDRLGYRFARPALLEEALSHASAGRSRDNQRLEFLGDALLNAAVTLAIHRERKDWQEGPMSKLRGLLVSTESLRAWAQDLDLPSCLIAGLNRKAPPMGAKPLADALEAVLAAVFLDAQAAGQDAHGVLQRLVEGRFLEAIRAARTEGLTQLDPKTHLQEEAARQGLPAPVYRALAQTGPGHAPRFQVRVDVGPHQAEAEGPTRKGAEAEAARRVLEALAAATLR